MIWGKTHTSLICLLIWRNTALYAHERMFNDGSGKVTRTCYKLFKNCRRAFRKNKQKYLLIPTLIYVTLVEYTCFQTKVTVIQCIFMSISWCILLHSFYERSENENKCFSPLDFSLLIIKTDLELLKNCKGGFAAINCYPWMPMLSLVLSKNTFYNRATYDKENGSMNRAIQNSGITEFQSWKWPCGLYESNSYLNGNVAVTLPGYSPYFIHMWILCTKPSMC